MAWRNKSKLRANAIKHGYRSGFEHKVSDQLKENKINGLQKIEKNIYLLKNNIQIQI